ncbi:MAG TPA: hypothetical protein VG842_10905 [Sediminibacterium sp.]|nr:hypothetical protein [Sediminibacterium sp.]
MKQLPWKKIWIHGLWTLAAIGTIVLLGSAMQQKKRRPFREMHIEIEGTEQALFVDEKDIRDILTAEGATVGNAIGLLPLRKMETEVEQNPWVKNAEMYLDNNQVLQVRIEEREPVARVFTLGGSSFYLDSAANRLPLREGVTARVPVFTGFPSDREKLAGPDSALLKDMVKMGQFILADSFWMAQVGEVHIHPEKGFEITPEIGNQLVILGSAENLPAKFDKLYTFYKKAWMLKGINTYQQLDLRFQNQLVARQEISENKGIDSIRLENRPALIPADSSQTARANKAMPAKPAPEKAGKLRTVKNQKRTEPLNNISNKSTLSKQAKNYAAKKTTDRKGNTAITPKAVMQKPKTGNDR